MNVGMPRATNYDAIVIGTSQGGRLLPIALAKAGRKVALIERGRLGGVCVNVGCTPTKTMVASARVAIWQGVLLITAYALAPF